MQKNKGISLIALVVTIIVLMILAGISIQMLRGETGIINQVKNADKAKNASEEIEAVEWAASQAVGDENNKTGTLSKENGKGKELINQYLRQYIGNENSSSNQFDYEIYEPGQKVTGENVDLTEDVFVVKFKESENIYIIDPDGTVHKDPTSGNGNNSNNGGNNGNNQGGNTGDGGQGGTEDPNEEIAKRDGIVLSKESMDVNNETTNTISITTNAKNLKITNSNDSVIELTEKNDKQITYVAKAIGRSTITVETEKGKKARCYVLVHQEPKKIVLDTTNIEFDLSENNNQHQITATIEPSTTNRDTDITWTSSNLNVAEVSSSGNPNGQLKSVATIKAKSNGTVTITASTKNGTKATCNVVVHTSPTKITLSKTNMTLDTSGLNANREETLGVTYTPSTSDIKKNITWTSSNTSVATVDSTGKVRGISSGNATIKATTENGVSAQCSVVVQTSITRITLNKTSATLDLSEVEASKNTQLSATITPSKVTEGYTWSSSNTNVATVNNNGYVSGKADGTTTITVRSSSGKVSATCTITVKTSIAIKSAQKNYTLNGGSDYQEERTSTCCSLGDCYDYAKDCSQKDDFTGAMICHVTNSCTNRGPDKCETCTVYDTYFYPGSVTIRFTLTTNVPLNQLSISWSGDNKVTMGSLRSSGNGEYYFTLTNDSYSKAYGSVNLKFKGNGITKDLYTWSIS